jgi:hypothetical protein
MFVIVTRSALGSAKPTGTPARQQHEGQATIEMDPRSPPPTQRPPCNVKSGAWGTCARPQRHLQAP